MSAAESIDNRGSALLGIVDGVRADQVVAGADCIPIRVQRESPLSAVRQSTQGDSRSRDSQFSHPGLDKIIDEFVAGGDELRGHSLINKGFGIGEADAGSLLEDLDGMDGRKASSKTELGHHISW